MSLKVISNNSSFVNNTDHYRILFVLTQTNEVNVTIKYLKQVNVHHQFLARRTNFHIDQQLVTVMIKKIQVAFQMVQPGLERKVN